MTLLDRAILRYVRRWEFPLKDNGAIIDLTLKFPENAPHLKL